MDDVYASIEPTCAFSQVFAEKTSTDSKTCTCKTRQHTYRFISRSEVDNEALTQGLLSLGGVFLISRIMMWTGLTNFIEVTLNHIIEQQPKWSSESIYLVATQPTPSASLESVVIPVPTYIPITFSTYNPHEDLSAYLTVKIEVPNRNTIKALHSNNGILIDKSLRTLNNEEIHLNEAKKRCLALLHASYQFKISLLTKDSD